MLLNQKRSTGLCSSQRPNSQHQRSHHIHRTHDENFKRLRKTITNSVGFQQDPSGNVINLSNKKFSVYQFQLLNKGLNFCPTPGYYNKNDLMKNLNTFTRRIKLKAHFGSSNTTNKTENEIFKGKSNKTWTPPNTHHTVKTYIDAITKDIKESETVKPPIPKSNLSKLEQTAIKQLQERDDIVITKADKGGATVIMDVNDYIKEAERQLNDTEYYKKLDKDPTATHAKLVNDAVERFKKSKEIPEKIADGLKTEKTRTPKFYIQPKIHKEGNPGRPVISSVECHTSNISKYVDFHLQPIVQSLPSYVKDTTDFLNKIKNIGDIPEESILVSLDVKSLYTNIPNKEGVFAVKQALEKLPPALKKVSTKVITTFLFLILTLNNFIFNCKHYLQRKGCAMGTVCAPTYANIFMGHFEDTYIYPKIVNKCKL